MREAHFAYCFQRVNNRVFLCLLETAYIAGVMLEGHIYVQNIIKAGVHAFYVACIYLYETFWQIKFCKFTVYSKHLVKV